MTTETVEATEQATDIIDPGWLRPLRGMDVACACPEDKVHCHGDVLLELANREEPTE